MFCLIGIGWMSMVIRSAREVCRWGASTLELPPIDCPRGVRHRRPLAEEVFRDIAKDVGQAEISPGVAVGQSFVVETQRVQ